MKKYQNKNTCNICGHPKSITYYEYDNETGKMEQASHIVNCLGHYGIHPSLWNRHPEYDKYRMLKAKQNKTTKGE